ncbi:MAG: biotin/lipoyl-binding protein [Lachnospiraceae bacterium]|nr:biotin/lipoyl-binding protein [Lachnospiraceae bacterium]
MKSYTITVNGNVYQVTVEENTGAAPVPQAAAAAPTAPAPVPAPVPAAPVPSAAAPAAAGGTPVEAPMMGKILDIKVSVGQAVKRGDSLFILEAMKMENEIVAPKDGTIASINANKGDTVESGTVLATLN